MRRIDLGPAARDAQHGQGGIRAIWAFHGRSPRSRWTTSFRAWRPASGGHRPALHRRDARHCGQQQPAQDPASATAACGAGGGSRRLNITCRAKSRSSAFPERRMWRRPHPHKNSINQCFFIDWYEKLTQSMSFHWLRRVPIIADNSSNQ